METIKVLWVDNEGSIRLKFYSRILEDEDYYSRIKKIYQNKETEIKKQITIKDSTKITKRKIQQIIERFNYENFKDKYSSIKLLYEEIHKIIGFEVTFVSSLKEDYLKSQNYHIIISDYVEISEDKENAQTFLLKKKEIIKTPIVIYSGTMPDEEEEIEKLKENIPYFYGWYSKGNDTDYENLLRTIRLCRERKEIKKEDFKIYDPSHLLHLFFPLDLDMQTLKILWSDDNSNKDDVLKYLKEMIDDAEDRLYSDKWYKAIEFIQQMPDEEKKKIGHFFSIDDKENSFIYKFLNFLNENKGKNIINDIDNINDISNNIDTFLNWYRELANASIEWCSP